MKQATVLGQLIYPLFSSPFVPQLPVPMFLPVTMDSAERIVETIQEIKEKIPSDPFEAELILMAEMVAEQDEKNEKEERPKEKVVEKEGEQQEPPAPDGKKKVFTVPGNERKEGSCYRVKTN